MSIHDIKERIIEKIQKEIPEFVRIAHFPDCEEKPRYIVGKKGRSPVCLVWDGDKCEFNMNASREVASEMRRLELGFPLIVYARRTDIISDTVQFYAITERFFMPEPTLYSKPW